MTSLTHQIRNMQQEKLAEFFERREMIPLPLDRTWLHGVEAESEKALNLAKLICPHMWARVQA